MMDPTPNSSVDTSIDINSMMRDYPIVMGKKGSSQDTLEPQEPASKGSNFNFDGDENEERGNWTGRLDFLLSCIGFAVGLGNVWRFPYLCYRNGGGAFLIPYAIMLALAGLPLFLFELSLGQYSSLGPITCWQISPLFKGLGYGMITISGLVCIYYNMIIAYTLFYFFSSFTGTLPWSHCNNDYNTLNCTQMGMADNESYYVGTNGTLFANGTNLTFVPVSPADEFWKRNTLDLSDSMDDMGGIRWQLALCLLLAWVVVFFCLSKGIKSTGKVVYFTALFPYVVLICLLCRGATLDGSLEGIKFYIIPDWERLYDAKVWGDAAVQIFYSLGPAWGGLITMSSYNRFHNNCYRDAIIVAITNCGTSVFAGFVIFSVIGYMAHELNVPVGEVTDSGPGLAFVAYPAGLALMPGAPFWALLFFFMLFTLGLDSMFAMMETIITALSDEFPNTLRKHKTKFTLFICIIGFFLGLPQCTRGGFYLLHLMDWYSASFSILTVALFEVMVVFQIYGYKRFADDFKCMVGFYPNIYWRITWNLITPATLLFIIIFISWQHVPCYLGDYTLPDWAQGLGWGMVVLALVWLPLFAIVEIVQRTKCRGLFNKWTWRRLFNATEEWTPSLQIHKDEREAMTNKNIQSDDDLPPYNGNYPSATNGYSHPSGYDNPTLTVDSKESINDATQL